MASTPLPLLHLLTQGRKAQTGSTFIPTETNEIVRQLIEEGIPDLGRDPSIEAILQQISPTSALQGAVQRPIDTLLRMVGLDPSRGKTAASGTGGPTGVGTPPIFPSQESSKQKIGGAISSAASSIIPLLIARNNPQLAKGMTDRATVLEEQRRGRVGQLLSEIQSRRQAETQRRGQDIQQQGQELRREVAELNAELEIAVRSGGGLSPRLQQITGKKRIAENETVTLKDVQYINEQGKKVFETLQVTRNNTTGTTVVDNVPLIRRESQLQPRRMSDKERGELAEAQGALQQIQAIKAGFDPKFVGPIAGPLRKFVTQIPGFVGGDIIRGVTGIGSFEEESFRIAVSEMLNQRIKDLSGAAVPVEEVPRLLAAIPDPSDNPVNFVAGIRNVESQLVALMVRKYGTSSLQGISFSDFRQGTQAAQEQPQDDFIIDESGKVVPNR